MLFPLDQTAFHSYSVTSYPHELGSNVAGASFSPTDSSSLHLAKEQKKNEDQIDIELFSKGAFTRRVEKILNEACSLYKKLKEDCEFEIAPFLTELNSNVDMAKGLLNAYESMHARAERAFKTLFDLPQYIPFPVLLEAINDLAYADCYYKNEPAEKHLWETARAKLEWYKAASKKFPNEQELEWYVGILVSGIKLKLVIQDLRGILLKQTVDKVKKLHIQDYTLEDYESDCENIEDQNKHLCKKRNWTCGLCRLYINSKNDPSRSVSKRLIGFHKNYAISGGTKHIIQKEKKRRSSSILSSGSLLTLENITPLNKLYPLFALTEDVL